MNPVQKALWFVENHSQESLSLERIADACNVSAYHLTRAFSAVTGRSLMRYVRARRLSEAARQLANGADDIFTLALDAGYGSHEAFTRAFRECFAMTPEQVRKQGHVNGLNLVEALSMNSTSVSNIAPRGFEQVNARTFAGLLQRHDCQKLAGLPAQWQRFAQYLGSVPGQVGEATYGVMYNYDGDNVDYLSAVEVSDTESLPEEFSTLDVPAQRYVVFAHEGHVSAISSTIAAIWNQWFPNSEHEATEAPMFECYGPQFNPHTGTGTVEVWIPIRDGGNHSKFADSIRIDSV